MEILPIVKTRRSGRCRNNINHLATKLLFGNPIEKETPFRRVVEILRTQTEFGCEKKTVLGQTTSNPEINEKV